MSKPSIFAGAAAPFAHLLGRGKPAAAKRAEEDEEDERKRKEGESDEDYDARMKKLDEEEDDEEAKKAEEEEREKEGKAALTAATAAGAKAERTRWTAVFAEPSMTMARVPTACALLSQTDLSADQVLATLKTIPEAAMVKGLSRIDQRMSEVRVPVVGADTPAKPGTDTPAGLAAAIVAAGRKARGEAA